MHRYQWNDDIRADDVAKVNVEVWYNKSKPKSNLNIKT